MLSDWTNIYGQKSEYSPCEQDKVEMVLFFLSEYRYCVGKLKEENSRLKEAQSNVYI